jgi:release factor glutamine methyltransferase
VTDLVLAGGITAQAAFAAARAAFREARLDTPELDARVLLAHVLAVPPASWLLQRERSLTDGEAAAFEGLIARRLAREPVARLVGHREFWGLHLALGPHTLVPRPDTETLVEAALEASARDAALRILDLGTGSGAILLALLTERPQAIGLGLDLSEDTLKVARANAVTLGLDGRAGFVRADWTAPILSEAVDIVVSNPPYISSSDIDGLEPEVRDHEPRAALDGGPDGLAAYRALLPQAHRVLRRKALLALEIGETQAADVSQLAATQGFSVLGPARRDLAGHERVILAVRE